MMPPALRRLGWPAVPAFSGAAIYVVLLGLVTVGTILNPAFASLANLRAQLMVGAPVGIVALGQTILILTGQIDLSVPWTMTFSAVVMASLYGQGYGGIEAFAAGLAVGGAVGLLNAVGVAIFRIQSLVWTLAMNTLLQGITLVYTNAQPPKSGVPQVAREMAIGAVAGVPLAFLLWFAVSVIAIVVMHRMAWGRALYATGTNPIATFFSGIDVRRVYVPAFVVAGLCSAVAGILLVGYTSESYLGMGEPYLLLPIAAVVIGGTNILGGSGGYTGTIAGVLVLLVLEAILSVAQISQAGRDVIFGLIILTVVVIYGRQQRAGG